MIFNREEQHLMLEGSVLSKEDVKRLVACHTEEASGFLYELYRFLEEWFSDSPYLTVKTSGSTGTPKLLKVRKEQMMQSARLTCEFLGLRQGDSVLLCMPLQYIAGKMVVVRALVVESGYPDSFRASDGGRGHTASLCRYGAVAGLQHTAGTGRKREALPDRYSYYRRRGNRCRVGS